MEDYILFDTPGSIALRSQLFEQHGSSVMVYPGPAPGTVYPILAGEGCVLAAGAQEDCVRV